MIDIKTFVQLKEKGLARVVDKTNENIILAFKEFDLEKARVGELEEKDEQVQVQSIKEIETRKTDLENEISELDSFLSLIDIEVKSL
jgi:hypothetical protein